ncbi:hypothetical protein BC833DRAFT_571318 [Globomyces pollinis-pini]|nr:hypothetical protein BC833DRAFT_571318 [Globomyces pollinis-pini]
MKFKNISIYIYQQQDWLDPETIFPLCKAFQSNPKEFLILLNSNFPTSIYSIKQIQIVKDIINYFVTENSQFDLELYRKQIQIFDINLGDEIDPAFEMIDPKESSLQGPKKSLSEIQFGSTDVTSLQLSHRNLSFSKNAFQGKSDPIIHYSSEYLFLANHWNSSTLNSKIWSPSIVKYN